MAFDSMQTPSHTTSASMFPVFLRLVGRRVLVVGGGEVALRKIRRLVRCGARVEVVAPKIHPELARMISAGTVHHRARRFAAAQMDDCVYVVAASSDRRLNAAVADAAGACRLFVNVVDDGAGSSATMPAIVERGSVTVAISSDGCAPVLSRRLRERLEDELPAGLAHLARFMGETRERVRRCVAPEARRALWERFLDGPGAQAALQGDLPRARRALESLARGQAAQGEVALVGAGPGDPDLLTLRALRLMRCADVVLYDSLVDPRILDLVRRDARRMFVGKRLGQRGMDQSAINAEMVRCARAGQRVVRLKGGDPFIFGRGGEEWLALAGQGVPVQVVPGISAANGSAAYAGIPLTHRDCAQACVFITGHAHDNDELMLPWESLAKRNQTVVIYMGRSRLPALCGRLISAGLPPDWPAAFIENGTRPEQRVLRATLADLPSRVEALPSNGPSLVIVGRVVRIGVGGTPSTRV